MQTHRPTPSPARPHRRSPARLAAVTLAALLGGIGVPELAEGRVQFRSASCYGETSSNDTDNLVVSKPAGTVAGDVMLASIVALDHDAPIAAPSGWTKILNDDPGADGTVTFSKVAGGSEPGSYSFFGNDSDIQIASITSFSGVDPANPIAPSPARATGSGSPWTLPNANSPRWGSMRVTAVSSKANVGSTYSAGLTEACDFGISTRAISSAYEPTDAGTTATRSVSRTGTAATVGHTVVLQSLEYCGTGSLDLTPPSTVSFPSTTLTGYDQTVIANPTFRVNDQRSTAAGWNLSGTSTRFANGARRLPADATRFVSAATNPVTGICELPDNGVSYPITLPAADSTAPAAVKLFNAAAQSGLGPVDIALATHLRIPSATHAGTYNSTWTFTLATGP